MDRRLRALGLAPAVLVAAGAYAAGALPAKDPGATLRGHGWAATPIGYRLGVAVFALGMVCWLLVWQQLGRVIAGRGIRWLAVTSLVWTVPLFLAPPLTSRDPYSYTCQGWLFNTGSNPYTTGADEGSCPWIAAVSPIWRHTTTPYGPLALMMSGAVTRIATLLPVSREHQLLVAIVLFRLIGLVSVLALGLAVQRLASRCGVDPLLAVWLGVATPLVAVHVLSAAHNDAVIAALMVGGLAVSAQVGGIAADYHAAFAPDHPAAHPPDRSAAGRDAADRDAADRDAAGRDAAGRWWVWLVGTAGVLFGLAASIKITALLALPFGVLLVVGAADRSPQIAQKDKTAQVGRGWMAVALGMGGACFAMFFLLTLVSGLGWGWIGALKSTATSVQWTSGPTALGMLLGPLLRGLGVPVHSATVIAGCRIVGMLVLAAAVAGLLVAALRHREQPRQVVLCCGAAFAVVAFLSPVFYPWYAIAPLAILACVARSEVGRRWLLAAGGGLCLLVLPNGLGIPVLSKIPGAIAVVCATGVLVYRWQRQAGGPGQMARGWWRLERVTVS